MGELLDARSTMPATRLACMALLLCLAAPLQAQETLAIPENVREEWAQVLRVDPVYQTLRANRTEQQCVQVPAPRESAEERGITGRIADAVRGIVGRSEPVETVEQCRSVPVAEEFRRPIAYDVEYSWKGSRYRSRLPYDPGHRIRLRISVTPVPQPGR